MNNELGKKLEEWSLGKDNYKYIAPGAEILKSVGCEMLFIEFNKEDGEWKAKNPLPVFIQRIGNFNPLTGTYEITYHSKENETPVTETITPEGFSFNDPENEGWMHRFITYSLHFKIMEEELYYQRLRTNFDTSENVLNLDSITVLQGGKQKESLGYRNYIAAVIDTNVEGGLGVGILSFRINGITKLIKRNNSWGFGIRDEKGYLVNVPKFQQIDGVWMCKGLTLDGVKLGDLKIMDIQNKKESENPSNS